MISLKQTLSAITSKFTALNTLLNDVPHYTLLWTNPNPTSSFSAQTISLDLSGYDAVKIVHNSAGDKCDEVRVGQSCRLSNISYGGSANYMTGMFRICNVTASGIKFNDGCYVMAVASYLLNNSLCIPQKIYGIKFGGGYNLSKFFKLRRSQFKELMPKGVFV